MIRVLIIGRTASLWAERLGEAVGEAVELDVARLPSAGIRQLEETPPDLVVIVDEAGGQRVETLVAAIRNRPIGQLLAVLLLCPQPSRGEVEEKIGSLDLAGWLSADASVGEVIGEIEGALDVELGGVGESDLGAKNVESPAVVQDPRGAWHSADSGGGFEGGFGAERNDVGLAGPVLTSEYLLEPLDFGESGGFGASERAELGGPFVERRSMFPSRGSTGFDGGLDAEGVLRKLKEVRHEDYYAVLEIRRGAESQTVREAFYRLYARFDPQKVAFELSHRFHAEFGEIRDALEDAWAVLGDPDLREPYLAHTVRK